MYKSMYSATKTMWKNRYQTSSRKLSSISMVFWAGFLTPFYLIYEGFRFLKNSYKRNSQKYIDCLGYFLVIAFGVLALSPIWYSELVNRQADNEVSTHQLKAELEKSVCLKEILAKTVKSNVLITRRILNNAKETCEARDALNKQIKLLNEQKELLK